MIKRIRPERRRNWFSEGSRRREDCEKKCLESIGEGENGGGGGEKVRGKHSGGSETKDTEFEGLQQESHSTGIDSRRTEKEEET